MFSAKIFKKYHCCKIFRGKNLPENILPPFERFYCFQRINLLYFILYTCILSVNEKVASKSSSINTWQYSIHSDRYMYLPIFLHSFPWHRVSSLPYKVYAPHVKCQKLPLKCMEKCKIWVLLKSEGLYSTSRLKNLNRSQTVLEA